ncbi:MAG: hypothetical protein NVS2B3_19400 [Vulcanimicrobiaceae bacterium]
MRRPTISEAGAEAVPPKKPVRRKKKVTQAQLVEARGRNLRQLLIGSTRLVGTLIEAELRARGYDDVRLSHSVLIANLDLEGNSITEVADRAQMTKQAMGLLAEELEALGYLTRRVDAQDARARVLRFTARGRRLLLESLAIIDDIERRYTAELGAATMDGLRVGLQAFLRPR